MSTLDAQGAKITIVGDDNYPPVIYLRQGLVSGILPEILAAVAVETGDQYEVQLLPWKRALLMSEKNKNLGIIGISRNKEREQIYTFSDPIYFDDIYLVTLKNTTFPFHVIEDLKGKRLGGQYGANYGEEIDRLIAQQFFLVDRDSNQVLRMKKLLAARIDAAIIGNGMAGFEAVIASDPQLVSSQGNLKVLPQPLVHDPLHLAFLKDHENEAIVARFNKALANFKKTAQYAKIIGAQNER